jgi:hypothetical protein
VSDHSFSVLLFAHGRYHIYIWATLRPFPRFYLSFKVTWRLDTVNQNLQHHQNSGNKHDQRMPGAIQNGSLRLEARVQEGHIQAFGGQSHPRRRSILGICRPASTPSESPWTNLDTPQFWELPESTEDIFSLFSPNDIRRTRDTALENLETLILAITSRLFILRHHPSFPDLELAPERDALNCIRILTRILPFIYEAEHLEEWEDKFFWGVRRKRTRYD